MIPDEKLAILRAALAANAESACRHLLPAGVKKGNRWCVGDIAGTPGDSMSVELVGEKAGLWHDFATDSGGDLIALWEASRGLKFQDAAQQAAEFLGLSLNGKSNLRDNYVTGSPQHDPPRPRRRAAPAGEAFDWAPWRAGMDDAAIAKLAEWRGYSPDFARWLAENDIVGCRDGKYGMPVRDESGAIVRVHFRLKDKNSFIYDPPKEVCNVMTPLVIGDPTKASTTFVLESQWDAFAVLDALHHHECPLYYAAVVTRGATSNLNLHDLLATASNVIAVPQNDPTNKRDKEGLTPAERWLRDIRKGVPEGADFRIAKTPDGFKDANDWIRADKPESREVEDALIARATSPDIRPYRTLGQLLEYPIEDDPRCLVGERWLCKGGSMVLVGSSGVGKSTFMMAMAFAFACGDPFFGITPKRPLRQIILQAENDEGDLAEMAKGAILAMRANARSEGQVELVRQKIDLIQKNLRFVRINDVTGPEFCRVLERQIRFHRAEIVWGDPLLSFIGDDISKQSVASAFLRDHLNPVLDRTDAAIIWVHHTGKIQRNGQNAAPIKLSYTDLAYYGLGSSEITNWTRGVMAITDTPHDGIFCFAMAKRGTRSGLVDLDGTPTNRIWLRHGTPAEGLAWFQVAEPSDDQEEQQESPKRGKGGRPRIDLAKFIPCLNLPASWNSMLRDLVAHPDIKTMAGARTILSRMTNAGLLQRTEDGGYSAGDGRITVDDD